MFPGILSGKEAMTTAKNVKIEGPAVKIYEILKASGLV